MIKRKRRSKKSSEFIQTLLFFMTTMLSISGLIIYLWVYTEIDETMLAIEVQNQVTKELDNSLKELKMEVINLSRSDRISSVARNELNMVPAEPETLMIFINKDQVGLLN
jgi:cell division protein FtsL|tara:strand:- start:284 stop:613 length:330 start_codon:yes stop_codon:yes gene_type:complete